MQNQKPTQINMRFTHGKDDTELISTTKTSDDFDLSVRCGP